MSEDSGMIPTVSVLTQEDTLEKATSFLSDADDGIN